MLPLSFADTLAKKGGYSCLYYVPISEMNEPAELKSNVNAKYLICPKLKSNRIVEVDQRRRQTIERKPLLSSPSHGNIYI